MSRDLVEIAGRRLSLANLEKELYPSQGFTKAQVLEYYRRIAGCILPHLHDRALTLKRYPDGVEGEYFFEKRCPRHRPEWVATAELGRDAGETMTVCLVNDLATLIWVGNLASLELHVPLARAASPGTPDAMVFDLDPGEPADVRECARVAVILRDLLSRLGLASCVKTSGRKGLHVFVPLNRSETTFEETKEFSRTVAVILQKNFPDLVTARMAKEQRSGKVFINWSQNDASKTMICAYSLRAGDTPVVSFPLAWEELESLVRTGDPKRFQISHGEALERTAAGGDRFRDVLTMQQKLPHMNAEPGFKGGERGPAGSALEEYQAKRVFEQTPEPPPLPTREEGPLVFIVHKHAARNLHYDLRLEMEGVLKSWAVPKGPSLDPGVKRLAVRVEDHPLSYRDFEGVIPEGNYGAGSVIVWDRGTFRHPAVPSRSGNEQRLLAGLAKGDLKFVLEGEKLRGEFALVKTGRDGKSWLLLKKKDRFAGRGEILGENRSVVSGKTVEDLLAGGADTASGQKKLERIRVRETLESEALRQAPRSPMPRDVRPMLATPAAQPFDHPDWLFEMKWDGYRAIAAIRDGEVALSSRNLLSLNHKFPPVVEALGEFRFEALLDGEIVVIDEQGYPDFQLLQNYAKSGRGHLLYYVFDLLHFQGHDLTRLPLLKRKELLKRILPSGQRIRFSDHVVGDGVLYFKVVRSKGLEGIVAKQAQSAYHEGKRSRQWLKLKTRLTQEGVIAGFTAPRGGRGFFGTLVLGLFEGGQLICIGHAGGGFGAEELEMIHARLHPLIRRECPFNVEPPTNGPATWVSPELVCEVAFSGWTEEGVMRHPVFLRMRDDKDARDVLREGRNDGLKSGG